MDAFFDDLRYGIRMLLKRPGLYAVAILTLALGIGVNSAVFSFVKTALLNPLPYRDSGRLVAVWQDYRRHGGREREWLSYPNFADLRSQNRTLRDLAIFQVGNAVLTGGQPESVFMESVSASTFDLLGVHFLHGRGFLPEEENHGAAKVAILGNKLWHSRYAGDPRILGKSIVIDGEPHTVVGILPPNFYAPLAIDPKLYTALQTPKREPGDRRELVYRGFGRLKPGVTLAQARADLGAVATRISQQNADAARDVGVAIYPLQDEIMGKAAPALLVLLVTAGFVLLITCVNVANLLLARAAYRRGEIGLRTALGATRRRLVVQMLNESLLLALLGGGLGIGVAIAGVAFLKKLAVTAAFPLPDLDAVQVDAGVVGFTLLTTIVTGYLFGLMPAFDARRADITRALKDGASLASGRSTSWRTAHLLVVAEIALALMLLVGSGLMLRSLARLRQVDTGFDPSRVLTFQLDVLSSRQPKGQQVRAFYSNLISRLEELPGVVSVGAISTIPMAGDNEDSKFRIEGKSAEERVQLWFRIISPGYFKASGLSLLQGRGIEERDQPSSPYVAVINRTAAEQYFPGENPIGRVLMSQESRFTIVGIAKNARSFSLTAEELPAVYLSQAQVTDRAMGIIVRTQGDPRQLAGPVRAILAEMDPTMAATNVTTLTDLITASLAPQRTLSLLLSFFGILALLLAAVGLYGLMTHLTGQRSREIGIRMALGSSARTVMRLIVGQAFVLSLAGIALGLLAALVAGRLLKSLLFEVSTFDVVSFAVSAAILLATALVASYLPARRASRLDPARVIRTS